MFRKLRTRSAVLGLALVLSFSAVATASAESTREARAVADLVAAQGSAGHTLGDTTDLQANDIPRSVLSLLPQDARAAAAAGHLVLSFTTVEIPSLQAKATSGVGRGRVSPRFKAGTIVCTISQYKITNGNNIIMNGWTLCATAMSLITDTMWVWAPGYVLASSANACSGYAACNDAVIFGLYSGTPGQRASHYCVIGVAFGGAEGGACHVYYNI